MGTHFLMCQKVLLFFAFSFFRICLGVATGEIFYSFLISLNRNLIKCQIIFHRIRSSSFGRKFHLFQFLLATQEMP